MIGRWEKSRNHKKNNAMRSIIFVIVLNCYKCLENRVSKKKLLIRNVSSFHIEHLCVKFFRFGVNAGLELTSCAFLVVTLFVYICLPVLRNLHGKTLMCHVACLIVAYASLAAVALGTPADPGTPDSMSTHICKFLGRYFSFCLFIVNSFSLSWIFVIFFLFTHFICMWEHL